MDMIANRMRDYDEMANQMENKNATQIQSKWSHLRMIFKTDPDKLRNRTKEVLLKTRRLPY